MNRLSCQADPGTGVGACKFVAVRSVHGVVPAAGYPPDSPMGSFSPGEPITTFACAVHLAGVEEAFGRAMQAGIHPRQCGERAYISQA